MLSLLHGNKETDLDNFHKRILRSVASPEYVAEIKYDGVAVSLHYEQGKFVRALSRGDGRVGEDITNNISAFVKDLPLAIDTTDTHLPSTFEVRGEVVVSRDSFEKIKERGTSLTTSRNVVAGLLNRKLLDQIAPTEYLELKCYSLLAKGKIRTKK